MNIHIASDGSRIIRLAKSEIRTLERAKTIVGGLCSFDPTLIVQLDNWGAGGLAELLELPMCQPKATEDSTA